MSMVGDGPEGQPTEGVATLTDLADMAFEAEAPEEESDGDADEGEGEESPEVEGEDESEEEESDEADEEEEPTETIKVNGKDVTLKKSELIEMAQKGADYTQKTMAVAEERKAVEAERAQVSQYRQQQEHALQETVSNLQAFAGFMETQLGEPPSIDVLHTQGSDVYLAHKEQYEHRRAQLQQAYQAIQQVQTEAQRKRQAWMVEQANETEKALRETLPGWNDDMLNELAKYGGGYGLTPEVAGEAFVSKGLWEVLHKAKAYDAIQAQKAQLKPKAQLPKVHKPTGNNQPNRGEARRTEALKRHKAKPSINTLADLMD